MEPKTKKTTLAGVALAAALAGAGVRDIAGTAFAETRQVDASYQLSKKTEADKCAELDAFVGRLANVDGVLPSRVQLWRLEDPAACYQVGVSTDVLGTFRQE